MRSLNKIFVTVGTTKFDDLINVILSDQIQFHLKQLHCKKLVIQFGTGAEIDRSVIELLLQKYDIEIECYRLKANILNDIKSSDLIISHAGAGSCLEVLIANKPLVAVVNDRLMDNHQTELAEQLNRDGYLLYCTPNTLSELIKKLEINIKNLKPYECGNLNKFVKHLNILMGFE